MVVKKWNLLDCTNKGRKAYKGKDFETYWCALHFEKGFKKAMAESYSILYHKVSWFHIFLLFSISASSPELSPKLLSYAQNWHQTQCEE